MVAELALWRSFGLHAMLIAAMWWLWSHRPAEIPRDEPITVEFAGEKDRKPSPRHLNPGSPRARSASRASRPPVTLDDLGMTFDPVAIARQAQSETAPADAVDNRDPQGDGWDLLNPDPKVARFNQYLYNVVQRELDRESQLGLRQFLGTVKIKLWFDTEGNYLAERTDFKAIDSEFRELVARSLKRAFARPIPKQYVYLDHTFSVQREVYVRRM